MVKTYVLICFIVMPKASKCAKTSKPLLPPNVRVANVGCEVDVKTEIYEWFFRTKDTIKLV